MWTASAGLYRPVDYLDGPYLVLFQPGKPPIQSAADVEENKGASIGGLAPAILAERTSYQRSCASLVVLIGAGLLVNSFLRLQNVQPAIATDRLLTAEINLSDSRYRERAQISRFFQELVRRVEALPGVEAASLSTARPLSGVARNDPFSIEGRPLVLYPSSQDGRWSAHYSRRSAFRWSGTDIASRCGRRCA